MPGFDFRPQVKDYWKGAPHSRGGELKAQNTKSTPATRKEGMSFFFKEDIFIERSAGIHRVHGGRAGPSMRNTVMLLM
jgi:hypothetical protein